MQISKRRLAAKPHLSRLLIDNAKKTMGPECQHADTAVGIWTRKLIQLLQNPHYTHRAAAGF